MRSIIATLVVAGTVGLFVVGCGSGTAAPSSEPVDPAIVEPIGEDASLHRITLTAQAADRLGIETVTVDEASGSGRTRVPYSAVIYGADGAAWAYVQDGGEHVFVRHALTIDEIVADSAGDYAVLDAGPAVGMTVVSVGVAELHGAEYGVGH